MPLWYHCNLLSIRVFRVKVSDGVAFHGDDAFRDTQFRVQRGPNENQVSVGDVPDSRREVVGEKDVAGDVEGREHANPVGVTWRTEVVGGDVKPAKEFGSDGCAIYGFLRRASPLR